jgi:glyoxylase-like metal-dependent hydrolase (beta-lactamase superfamily II)
MPSSTEHPANHVTEIVPDVYDITWEGTEEGSDLVHGMRWRSFLCTLPGNVPTLIDTCLANRVERLTAGIRKVGIEPKRLIITHNHPDHVDAIDDIVETYDVETWFPKADAPDETSDETLPFNSTIDNFYTNCEEIGRFEAVHVGGHTPGSSALVDEDSGIAICGDTLNGADRRGLPAGYLIHPPQATHAGQSPQAVVTAEENLVRLLNYEFDVALVYHGSSVLDRASEKLYEYINFSPKYVSDEISIHQSDRQPHPDIDPNSNLDESE